MRLGPELLLPEIPAFAGMSGGGDFRAGVSDLFQPLKAQAASPCLRQP